MNALPAMENYSPAIYPQYRWNKRLEHAILASPPWGGV